MHVMDCPGFVPRLCLLCTPDSPLNEFLSRVKKELLSVLKRVCSYIKQPYSDAACLIETSDSWRQIEK